MAPTGNFEIRHLMPRNSTYDSHRPIVSFGQTNDIQQQSANHTQAIILSGGYNMANNYQRYWNDCSFIYQTLTKRYCIPKENISVLMSDGTDPAPDMRITNTYRYKSQPLDLDGDGLDDIQYAATRENVQAVLNGLLPKMLLSSTGTSDSEITVSAIEKTETRPLRQKINATLENMSIDASSLPSGLYVVVMTIDGTVVDSVKFNKM